jgi:TRAP-type C4-dicarboxylate transport system permease small subunit
MRTIGRTLDRFEEIALIGLLVLVVAITFGDVLARNLRIPVTRMQEFVPNLFVWATWLGVPYAIRRREHFRVRVLPSAVARDLAASLKWTVVVVGLAFFGVAVLLGLKVVLLDVRLGNTTPLGYSAAFLDAAVPVGSALAAVRLLQGAWRTGKAAADEDEP